MVKRPKHNAKVPVDDGPSDEVFIQGDDNDGEELEEDVPRVLIGTLADLAMDQVVAHRDRPIWFLLDEFVQLVGLFDRYPEKPMPADTTQALLATLRQFTSDNASDLQTLLGPTSRLHCGFHTSASVEEVCESFEDDGFDVLIGLREGHVELPEI